jgi:hypothetical protein
MIVGFVLGAQTRESESGTDPHAHNPNAGNANSNHTLRR